QPAGAFVAKSHRPAVGDAGQQVPGVSLVLRPGGAAGSGGDYPSQGAVAAVIVVVALLIVVRVVVAGVGEAVDRSRERRRRGQFPRFTAVPRPRHVQLRSGRVHPVAAADDASPGIAEIDRNIARDGRTLRLDRGHGRAPRLAAVPAPEHARDGGGTRREPGIALALRGRTGAAGSKGALARLGGWRVFHEGPPVVASLGGVPQGETALDRIEHQDRAPRGPEREAIP